MQLAEVVFESAETRPSRARMKPEGERQGRDDRRDRYVFLGFVAVLLAGLIGFVVAQARWSDHTWTAIGSIGAFGQAIAVTAGLLYAGLQLQAYRRESAEAAGRWKADRALAAATNLGEFIRSDLTPKLLDLTGALYQLDDANWTERLFPSTPQDEVVARLRSEVQAVRRAAGSLSGAISGQLTYLATVAAYADSDGSAVTDAVRRLRYACTAASNAMFPGYVDTASTGSQDAVVERLLASADEAFKGLNAAVLAMIARAHLAEERRESVVAERRNG